MSGLVRARAGLTRGLEVLVVALVVGLALLVVVGVGFRKAGAALVWYDEVASIMLAWLTYYGAALAAVHRAHLGFPRFVQNARGRTRQVMIAVRETAVIGFLLVMAWAGWRVLGVLEGTMLVGLPWMPTRFTQSVIPIGAMLFIIAELLSLVPEESA